MYKNNVDICNSVNDNFRLGNTRLHFMALDCILRHSAAFQDIRMHSKAFSCILRHSAPFQGTRLHSQGLNFDSDRLSMEGSYESANQQGRLRVMIAQYIKTLSGTKVAGNTFCIVFSILISKITAFMYKIKHLDSLIETLLLSITPNTIFFIHYTKNIANYNALSTTFYIDF
jgi:hypothetical protein